MSSAGWYTVLVVAVALERLVELAVSKRNIDWAKRQGAIERGFAHYPFMVALHAGLLAGCLVEVWLMHTAFYPWLGWPMVALVVASQALRWWCIRTLGLQWNTRVVVVPGAQRVPNGPYRFFPHPNYIAVVVEGIALPMVHTAWITATVFTAANAFLLRIRVRTENAALRDLSDTNAVTTVTT